MSAQPLEDYNTMPAIAPPVKLHELSNDPAWLAGCEKLGFHPLEWPSYQPPPPDFDKIQRRMEEQEAAQAVIRAEYEVELARLIAVIRFAPKQIREALQISEWRGQCNCERCDV